MNTKAKQIKFIRKNSQFNPDNRNTSIIQNDPCITRYNKALIMSEAGVARVTVQGHKCL
jgi:hypothetical protein